MSTPASPAPATPRPPRARLWIPLPLRFFVVILVVLPILGSAWIGVTAYRRQTAIREIRRLGGTVAIRQAGQQWLRDWVGGERMMMFGDAAWKGCGSTALR